MASWMPARRPVERGKEGPCLVDYLDVIAARKREAKVDVIAGILVRAGETPGEPDFGVKGENHSFEGPLADAIEQS